MGNNLELNQQEVLIQLLEENRQRERRDRIVMWVIILASVLLVTLAVVLFIKVIPALNTYNALMADVDIIKNKIKGVVEIISLDDVENIRKTLASNSEEDTETLRSTHNSLSGILAFLSRFGGGQ